MRTIPPTLALLLALSGSAFLLAQEPTAESEPSDLFLEQVEVNVVNVEVFVTDGDGNRVRDLTADDFLVREDRREMKVTNFYVVEKGIPQAAAAPQGPAVPSGGEAEVATPAPAPVPIEREPLHLVVYVDNYNIRPFNRNRVFRYIREFLQDELTQGDRVMLVSYDRSLHVRREFTADPTMIATGLFELETVSAHAVHQDSDRRDILDAISQAEGPGEVSGRVDTYAKNLFNDLSFTITSLQDFVTTLGGLPGRKAILYVSDGVPMRAAEEIYYRMQQKFGEQVSMIDLFEFDASRRWEALAAQSNANQVTLYTIDAAGLRAPASASVEESEPGVGLFVDQIRISNLQSTLQLMAEQTGGIAIINSNNPTKGLKRIAEDFETYYSIGYVPAHSGDGRYHRIDVEVKDRKGLTVRHRLGYRDKSAGALMSDGTLSSLRYGVESNPLGVELAFGNAERREDGNYQVPVLLTIPLGNIVVVPREDVYEGRIRVFFSAADEEGGMAPVQEVTLPIRIPKAEIEEALSKSYLYKVELMMRRGRHRVAAGVRDDFGRSASFLRRSVAVGR